MKKCGDSTVVNILSLSKDDAAYNQDEMLKFLARRVS